ncbi:MAG TPA: O-methyltransferase [Chloroflexia bacterium]|nr:O-methyltransferase [Chloroflexia bacterium]
MKHFGITDPAIEEYIYGLLPTREGVLADMEAQAERDGVPIVGPLAGQLLYTLAIAFKAKDMLDVGTAIGYSAMWLGLAAQKSGGRVVGIEKDESRSAWAEAYFRQANLSGVCAVRKGDAFVLMAGMEESFDLIMLDILTQLDRPDASLELLNLCVRRLRPGGVLLSDNALRSGQVLQPENATASTQGIAAFNKAIAAHPRLVSSIIPLRDGISLSVKI